MWLFYYPVATHYRLSDVIGAICLLAEQELRESVLHHRLRGTHQIVPVGQTLWMDLVWDGKDMIQALSRTIR